MNLVYKLVEANGVTLLPVAFLLFFLAITF